MLLFLCRNYSHSQRVVGVLHSPKSGRMPGHWNHLFQLPPCQVIGDYFQCHQRLWIKKGGAGYWNTGTIFLGIFEHCKGEGPRKGLSSKRNVPFFPPSHRGTTLTGCGQNPGRTASGSSAGCQSAAGRAAGCPPPAGAGPASGRATCWAHTTAR